MILQTDNQQKKLHVLLQNFRLMETRVVDGYSHYNSIINDGRRVRRMRRTQLSAQKIKNNSNSSRKAYILKTQTDFCSRQKSKQGLVPKIQPKRRQIQGLNHKKHLSNVHNEYYTNEARQLILNNQQSYDRSQQHNNNRSKNGLALSKQSQRISNERKSQDSQMSQYKQNYNQFKRRKVNNRTQRVSKFNNLEQPVSKNQNNASFNQQESHQQQNNQAQSDCMQKSKSNKIQSINKNSKLSKHHNQYGFLAASKNSKKSNRLGDDLNNIVNNSRQNNHSISGQVNNSQQAYNKVEVSGSYNIPNFSQNRKVGEVYVVKSSVQEWQNRNLQKSPSIRSSRKSIKQSSMKKSQKRQDSVKQSFSRQYLVKHQSSFKQKSVKQNSLNLKSPKKSENEKSQNSQQYKGESPKLTSQEQVSVKQQFQKKQIGSTSTNQLYGSSRPTEIPFQSSSSSNRQVEQPQFQKPSSHLSSDAQRLKQSSMKQKNSKQPSQIKEIQQIFSKNNSVAQSGSVGQNFSKLKLDPSKNHVITSSSARKQNWREPLNSLSQVEQERQHHQPNQQSGYIPSSNGKQLYQSSKRYSLRVESLNQSTDQKNLPILSKGPNLNGISSALRKSLRSNNVRTSQVVSGSSIKHDPSSIQALIDNLDIHQYFIGQIEDFRIRTQEISPDAEYLDLLCYLLDRKYYLEKVNIKKALEGGFNVFRLSQFQISKQTLRKYRQSSTLVVLAHQTYQQSKELFKKLRDSYYQLKPRLKNNMYFQLETPVDNFSKQIVRLLQQQLKRTEQKLNENNDSQWEEIYEFRILQIFQMVFLLSELNGRKVKKLELYDEIQNFTQYYEQNEKKLQETFLYFKNLP